MATVCVGCGFTVIGGRLTLDGGGLCDEADLGLICNDDGYVDWVIPAIARRVPDFTTVNSSPGIGVFVAQITNEDFGVAHDSAAGIMQLESNGSVTILCPGVYTVHLTGGALRDPDDVTNHLVGGRARIFNGTSVLASSGFAAYEPAGVDFSSTGVTGDGPEWCCSFCIPLDAAANINWAVDAQTDADAVNVSFPRSVNFFSIARLGGYRS